MLFKSTAEMRTVFKPTIQNNLGNRFVSVFKQVAAIFKPFLGEPSAGSGIVDFFEIFLNRDRLWLLRCAYSSSFIG